MRRHTRDQDEWALGLEIVDPRYGTYDFDWLDNTADNSSCARIAVGPFNPRPDAETVGITFSDSRSTRHGDSSDALGGPTPRLTGYESRSQPRTESCAQGT